jgi:hypothetical protein
MHERAFVLVPLLEIAPAATIPGRGAARRWLRGIRGQRIARTRTHFRRGLVVRAVRGATPATTPARR